MRYIPITEMPTVAELVKHNNVVRFEFFRAGVFYYQIVIQKRIFIFPVPCEDIGNGTLCSYEKAIKYMVWIRKSIEENTIQEIPPDLFQIKKAIDAFRSSYYLVSEIDRILYVKGHFLGQYNTDSKDKPDVVYVEYVDAHNSFLRNRISFLENSAAQTAKEYENIIFSISKMKESIISTDKKDWSGRYLMIPDNNILRHGDSSLQESADFLSKLKSKYMYDLYPAACDEHINKIELNAYNILTSTLNKT